MSLSNITNYLNNVSKETIYPDFFNKLSDTNNLEIISIQTNLQSLLNDFYHIVYFTDNCLITTNFFINQLGFKEIYYTGLETGNKHIASRVVSSNNVIIEIVSSLDYSENYLLKTKPNYFELMNLFCRDFLNAHGDGIGMISFKSGDKKNSDQILNKINLRNGNYNCWKGDDKWSNFFIKIKGTNIYQLILNNWEDHFNSFTEYKKIENNNIENKKIKLNGLSRIDHIVLNVPEGELTNTSLHFQELYQMFEFWKPKSLIKTSKTGLNTKVLSSFKKENNINANVGVKFPINEPLVVDSEHMGQIEEFLNYNNGSGIQHVAFVCQDIIKTVENLTKYSSVQFLKISSNEIDNYYNKIWALLTECEKNEKNDLDLQNFVKHLLENFDKIKSMHILVDINTENEILLQIFTKNLNAKPGLFFEYIQRFRNQGFGEGNFNSLFKSIEEDQRLRGTL